MAITGLSEFMFGYGFLYEQTHAHWGELRAAPVLPNLQQEQSLGWDAHIPLHGTDFYYQFKLSDYLSRATRSSLQTARLPLERTIVFLSIETMRTNSTADFESMR